MSDQQASGLRKFWREWWGLIVALVILRVVRWLTDWPWWYISLPAAIVCVGVVAWEWRAGRLQFRKFWRRGD